MLPSGESNRCLDKRRARYYQYSKWAKALTFEILSDVYRKVDHDAMTSMYYFVPCESSAPYTYICMAIEEYALLFQKLVRRWAI